MQHKRLTLFTALILLSLLIAPVGAAQAQPSTQNVTPDCPPFEPGVLQNRELLRSLPGECVRDYKEADRQADSAMAQGNPSPATAVSGPDFNYTFDDTAAYNWISATTNSGLTGYDQFTGPINIGFNFPFYGIPQSQLYFNTNGIITFGAGSRDAGYFGSLPEVEPNNMIAPFADYLVVGSPYNNGAIYYARGGTTPNRYFVVEWRNITQDSSPPQVPFSFEAILYENGDIVFQYKSLPSNPWSNFIGMEDSLGYQQMEYTGNLTAMTAFRYYYPTVATARLLVSPLLQTGGFAPVNGHKVFPIKVINPGTLGVDTYDFSKTSTWPVTFYASDGITPLTDTDGDSLIDTGSLPRGTSTTVMARVSTPNGAAVGANDMAIVTIASSLNASKTKTIYLFTSIPANFASVFQDEANGAMSFMTVSGQGTSTSKATADNYFGYEVAMTRLANNNYFYIWSRRYYTGSIWVEDIEYAVLSRTGAVVSPVTKLANNSSATIIRTYDNFPSVAQAPDGTIGIAWIRYKNDTTIGKFNYNVYFATLNAAGTPLTGPTNTTNNNVWSTSGDPVITRLLTPAIAASSDNRFVIGWNNYMRTSGWDGGWEYDIWYAIRNTAGANVYSPHVLTGDHASHVPVLNPLTGGKVIVTWYSDYSGESEPQYAVINSNGSLVSIPYYNLANSSSASPDAVQLPDGKVAIAWPTYTGVVFAILNSSYIVESGDAESTPAATWGDLLSVTTDASSRVIMTWVSGEAYHISYYALGDSAGELITPPMIYKQSGHYVENSWNGQGMAPYQTTPIISGNAGVAGATLNYTGGSTTADSVGYYSISVPSGWSGTVTPSKSGYIFLPAKRTYSNVTTSQTAQNYTATAIYTISGNTGVGDVTLSYTDGTAETVTSQPNGNYSLVVPNNWNGTVTPTHPCFTFSPASQNYNNVTSHQSAQDYTPSFLGGMGCADIDITVGGEPEGRFALPPEGSTRISFAGVNDGPVQIVSNNAVPLIGAERVIYRVKGVQTSFTELMGLPEGQLDNIYWLPWYNNVNLDTQLRIANATDNPATVTVTIGGIEMPTLNLAAGESTRVSYDGVNDGPVKIESNRDIVAAERVVYTVQGVQTSFSEMMALPDSQLDTTYWLPWYNNVNLDTQLRIGNVSNSTATVHVFIGGEEVTLAEGITLLEGESTRLSYTGVNDGPVQIVSDVPIVAAERVIYKVNNIQTSFSEMMGLPDNQLDTSYWLPWYNNKDLDTQIRFANTTNAAATVHIYIGGVEMANSPFTVEAGESTRVSFLNVNNGPVQIESDVPIVAAERVIYKVQGIQTSFSEMMALPASQLDSAYWFPWYNNLGLDTQLRFGVP